MKTLLSLSRPVFVFMLLLLATTVVAANPVTVLKVALYPYVPLRLSLFQKIEHEFEKRHPGVNVELIDNDSYRFNYYAGELLNNKADVYEIDTILLPDMIQAGKVAPLDLPDLPFTAESIKAVTRDNITYAIPHWLCGNFLFYRRGDTEVEQATTWRDLNTVLSHRSERILVDFKGTYTLGEWYLTALSGLMGVDQAQRSLSDVTINQDAVKQMHVMLENCPVELCRSNDRHDRTGYHARAFISGMSSAYIGYSESMHYALQHYRDHCLPDTHCLAVQDIAVRPLPEFITPAKDPGLGWVDALAVSADLSGYKKELAIKFVQFMVSETAFRLALEPDTGDVPRYLLPARTDISISGAPLYADFYRAHEGRETAIGSNLNEKLQVIGKKLECLLPSSPKEVSSSDLCKEK